MIRRLPAEIVASLLAATTVIISLPPFNLPPWAVFVSWAGTFAAGGRKPDVLRRIWGHLPEKVRDDMQASFSEQFLPKYERLIEEYYKRLAEERPAAP